MSRSHHVLPLRSCDSSVSHRKKKLVSTYVHRPCTPYPDTISLRASCQFHVFTVVHYIELTAIYRYCHYNCISAAQSTRCRACPKITTNSCAICYLLYRHTFWLYRVSHPEARASDTGTFLSDPYSTGDYPVALHRTHGRTDFPWYYPAQCRHIFQSRHRYFLRGTSFWYYAHWKHVTTGCGSLSS